MHLAAAPLRSSGSSLLPGLRKKRLRSDFLDRLAAGCGGFCREYSPNPRKEAPAIERILRVTLTLAQEGMPLLPILRGELGISHTLLKRIKTYPGGIRLDGQPVHVDARARAGAVLEVLLEPATATSPGVEPVEGPLDIVYEDEDLLVLNKPAGIPVHPSSGHLRDSLANFAAWHFARRGESLVFRPVNRLDKCTSGLLTVAKSAYVQEHLRRQRESGLLVREYLAVAEGRPAPSQGTVDVPIARLPGSVLRRQVDPAGQRAITHYRTEAAGASFSLLRLVLDTGRTHQIRVHMAYLGHPLAGDFLYGTEGSGGMTRTALHAAVLRLRQLSTGRPLSFAVPLPADMEALTRDMEVIPCASW